MASKRKKDLEASLESGASPAGWRDKFQVSPQEEKPKYQRKTYLLEPEMVEHIANLAEREQVPINDLVRFLLDRAIEQVESGELQLPVKVITVKKRRLE